MRSQLHALDGLRGLLAVWVMLGHVTHNIGAKIILVSSPAFAVDGFMVLSGLLMAMTWDRSSAAGDTSSSAFMIRRIARIYPAFLFVSGLLLFFGAELALMEQRLREAMPPSWAIGQVANLKPWAEAETSIAWWVIRVFMLQGVIPGVSSASPIPDWSLSLEMQFYLICPLLLPLILRGRFWILAIVSVVLAAASPLLLGNYGEPGRWTWFGQPSALPYRLNVFIAGAVLYLFARDKFKDKSRLACIALCSTTMHPVSMCLLWMTLFLVARPEASVSRLLGSRPLAWLGKISYSVYVLHMIVVIPVCYVLLESFGLLELSGTGRFLVAGPTIAVGTIALSALIFRFVEQPGMNLGKRLTKRVARTGQTLSAD